MSRVDTSSAVEVELGASERLPPRRRSCHAALPHLNLHAPLLQSSGVEASHDCTSNVTPTRRHPKSPTVLEPDAQVPSDAWAMMG